MGTEAGREVDVPFMFYFDFKYRAGKSTRNLKFWLFGYLVKLLIHSLPTDCIGNGGGFASILTKSGEFVFLRGNGRGEGDFNKFSYISVNSRD